MKSRLFPLFLALFLTQGMTAQLTSLGLVKESNISAVDTKDAVSFVPEISFVGDYLYVATPNGLYRYLCENTGEQSEWEKLPLTDKLVLDFVVRGDTLIVLTREQLFFSSDGGKTTHPISVEEATDSGRWALSGMAVHPHSTMQIYLACGAKLMHTQDGGATWNEICKDDGSRIQMTRMFYNPHNPHQIVGFYNNTNFMRYGHLKFCHNQDFQWKSADGACCHPGGGDNETYNMVFHPIIDNRVIVCGWNIYGISNDGGASWSVILKAEQNQLAAYLTDIVYDKRNPNILYGLETTYLGTNMLAIQRSTDGGYTWEEILRETVVPKGSAFSLDMKDNLLALYTYAGGIYLLDVDAIGTSISPVVSGGGTAPYYDLMGRKVTQPTRGIYIRDGRKVVIE